MDIHDVVALPKGRKAKTAARIAHTREPYRKFGIFLPTMAAARCQ